MISSKNLAALLNGVISGVQTGEVVADSVYNAYKEVTKGRDLYCDAADSYMHTAKSVSEGCYEE